MEMSATAFDKLLRSAKSDRKKGMKCIEKGLQSTNKAEQQRLADIAALYFNSAMDKDARLIEAAKEGAGV